MVDYCEQGAQVVPQSLLKTRLTAMIAVDGELEAPKVKLFINDITPGPLTILTDLTIPTFGGYAAKNVTWGLTYDNPDGGVGVSGGAPDWVTTDAVSETVYGYFLTDAGGTTLLEIRRLAVPQNTGSIGLHIQVAVEYSLPGPVGDVVPVA